jgi:hypothetical protein
MPGGNPTINNPAPDLGSFLARKRIAIELWLLQKNIISIEAFQSFMEQDKGWNYSTEFIAEVSAILKSVEEEIDKTKRVEPVVAVVEKPLVVEPVQPVVEEPVASEHPVAVEDAASTIEDKPFSEEGSEVVSEPSFVISAPKERKKTK